MSILSSFRLVTVMPKSYTFCTWIYIYHTVLRLQV